MRASAKKCQIRQARRPIGSDASYAAGSGQGVGGNVAVAISPRRRTCVRADRARVRFGMESFARLRPSCPATSRGPSRPRSRRRSSARSRPGEHLVAEAGTGTGKSLAYLIPALESGQRVVVATATKALQEQLLDNDVPVAAAGARPRGARRGAQGPPELPLPQAAAGLRAVLGGALLRDGGRAAFDAMRAWLDVDRDRRPGRARRSSRRRRSGPSSPSAPTAASGRRCAVLSASASPRRRASAPREAELVIANHALYFADLALRGRRRPACCPSTTPSSSTRRTGSRSPPRPGSAGASARAALRAPRCATSSAPAARPQEPAPGARARPRRARGRPAAPRGRAASGRRRLREPPPSRRSCSSTRSPRSRDGAAGRSGDELDALARRGARLAGAGRGAASTRRARPRSSGRSPTRSRGRPSTSRPSCATALGATGPTAILVSATLDGRRDFALRPPAARSRRGARARGRLAVRLRRAGAPLPAARDARPARAGRARARRRGGGRALRALRGPRARADELATARSTRSPTASAAGCRTSVLVQGEAPRERLLERFRDEVDSVLLATSTFWQGIDVPGEALSLLVIDKLPFARARRPARRGALRADRGAAAATGSATTRCRRRCSSCGRASAG